jgi:hypothetical protein
MGHAEIENMSPFAFQPLFLSDEEGRPLIVLVVKATYSLAEGGKPSLAEEQVPVNIAGEFWGDPDNSSYKYEPETAFTKPATDVVLIGHGYPPDARTTEFEVSLKVGPLRKTLMVVGDRYWTKSLGIVSVTNPQQFEKIPLVYERAFGGWDRSDPDPKKHRFEPRNPVGRGFRAPRARFEEGVRLPNLEDPQRRLRNYGDTSPPAGFGFISPNWEPRAALGGTYDDAWMKERMPLLPKNFDRGYFNSASAGLVARGFLRGNEPVFLENASRSGRLNFQLPDIGPPACEIKLRGRSKQLPEMNLDTLIINTDENVLFLIWRGSLALRNGPHDVLAIGIQSQRAALTAGKR